MIEITTDGNHTMYYYTVGETAKMLQLRDSENKPVGRNRFFRALRYNGVLIKDNSPSQIFITLGLAVLHKTTKRWKTYTVPVFTEKGVNYLKNKFETGGYILYLERDEPQEDCQIKNIDEIL